MITLIIGGLLTYFSQWGTDRRQHQAARQALETDRAYRRQERRETFELEHLLRLNEALMRYARAVGRMHHHDSMVAKTSSVYASHLLPEDISQEAHETGRDVLGSMNLALDDELRAKVNQAYELLSDVESMTKTTPDRAKAAMLTAIDAYREALNGIAARIRQIYLDQAI
ncbi:hypothetical protein RB614_40525 [Phytohabitans sp. ZYX-F-186]|uniref:Uncharacterized protein n=1 Tax=Phytohabitans maris TaxID=3071409 RepID=A0ABU0ZUS9_9ACTN|nr:hypothetical protein [Phytohabitans sp. ZYX-F-186]MDQ7910796.1 hypothetical protein [Phytohabitans sp. ZYX-F-186]